MKITIDTNKSRSDAVSAVALDAPVLTGVTKLPDGSVKLNWSHSENPKNFMETELYAKRVGVDENFLRIGIAGNTDTECAVSDPTPGGNGEMEIPWQSGQAYVFAVQAYGGDGIASGVDSDMSNEIGLTY